MKRSLALFYVAASSLTGFVGIMLYPAFWQVLYLTAIAATLTYMLLVPGNRIRYLLWLGGLGAGGALVAAVFGSHGDSLSPLGSVIGFTLLMVALGVALHLYRMQRATEE